MVYRTSSNTNPTDFLTKVKPASTYLDNPLWETVYVDSRR